METVVSVCVPKRTKVIKGKKYICTSGPRRGDTYLVVDFVKHDSTLQELVLVQATSGYSKGEMFVCTFSKFCDRYVLKNEEESYGT